MLAACVADSVILPIPVNVRDVPLTDAGPLITVYLIAPVELDVALRVMIVLLNGWPGIGTKATVGVMAFASTMKLVVAVAEV